MRRLSFVLYQMDEARRYLAEGRIEQVRLALLLLDNAIEPQMDRRIQSDLGFERLRERLREQLLQMPVDLRGPDAKEHLEWSPLTKREKKISWAFPAKVKYLSERQPHLDPRLVRSILYIHGYPNEAYHRAEIRHETVRTAALILLELNCQLLLTRR